MASKSTDTPTEMPTNSSETPAVSSQESMVVVDLRYVFKSLLKWSWVIALATGFGVYSGVKDAHNFTPRSTALMILGPSEISTGTASSSTSDGGRAAVISLLGGGGGVSSGMTSVDRLIHVAGTLSFAQQVQEKYGIMQRAFAGSWDFEAKAWKPVRTEPSGWEEKILWYLNSSRPSQPTLEDLANFFSGVLQAKIVVGTPYVEVRVELADSEFALDILNLVLREGAAIISEKETALIRSQSNFLEDRLRNTRLIEHRTALVALLSEQARKEMMMTGELLPMVSIIEKPYVSKYKTEPNVRKLIGLPGLIGFILSSLIVVFVSVFRRE